MGFVNTVTQPGFLNASSFPYSVGNAHPWATSTEPNRLTWYSSWTGSVKTSTMPISVYVQMDPSLWAQHKRQMLHRAIWMALCPFSRSLAVLRAMNLRYAAILPTRLVYVLFCVSCALHQAILSCFCYFSLCFSLVCWLFLRCFSVRLRLRIRYRSIN